MGDENLLSCPQFGILKKCKTIGVEDRFSDLPDEILSHILRWLTLKEAIATSILSKRWKKSWVSCPNLDFGCLARSKMDMHTYVQCVDKILSQYDAQKLHKLRIVRPLIKSISHQHHFDDWISFAFRNGVSELELNLNSFPLPGHSDNYYVTAPIFGLWHTTFPNFHKHFESLTDLCLRSVNLSDDVFDLIFSSCYSLERFLLEFSHGLVHAKNTAPHLKLKSLELYLCEDLAYLHILAPNLVSFKYQGKQRFLCIKDAKQLASLRLSTFTSLNQDTSVTFAGAKISVFSQFSQFPKLKSLVVSAHLFEGEDMNDFMEFDGFSNLKQLVLDVLFPWWTKLGYRVVASIIRVAPLLETLEIVLPPYEVPTWPKDQALELASMARHHNLKEVKLVGFRGDKNTMKFLSYLSKYAVSLQKIDVTARGAVRLGEHLSMLELGWTANDAEHTKNCVLKLRQNLHVNAQLLFHDG